MNIIQLLILSALLAIVASVDHAYGSGLPLAKNYRRNTNYGKQVRRVFPTATDEELEKSLKFLGYYFKEFVYNVNDELENGRSLKLASLVLGITSSILAFSNEVMDLISADGIVGTFNTIVPIMPKLFVS